MAVSIVIVPHIIITPATVRVYAFTIKCRLLLRGRALDLLIASRSLGGEKSLGNRNYMLCNVLYLDEVDMILKVMLPSSSEPSCGM